MSNIQERRQELHAISMPIQALVKEGAIDSVNSGLVQYYASQGHTELNTFNQWLAQGYRVKKGEKALCLWGKPKQSNKVVEENKEEQDLTYFPICYVFSKQQVIKNDN